MATRSIADSMGALLKRVPIRHKTTRLVVLCYHSVHASALFAGRTGPATLERHMRWLREACEVVSFEDVVHDNRVATNGGRPTVAVTFDDGYADNYTQAVPILLRYSIPATFFVSTGLINRQLDVLEARSWQGFRELGSTMTWDQVRSLREMGMTIGSHGHLHTPLSRLSELEMRNDLARSKTILERHLREDVTIFAYPRGRPRRDFGATSVIAVRESGYEAAAAILLRGVRESDRPMAIPRFPIADDPLDVFRAKVTGRLDLIGSAQERAPLKLLRA